METRQFDTQRNRKGSWSSIGRCAVSLSSVLLTQFSLCTVPRIFPSFSLLTLLCISAFVLLLVGGLGRCFKRLLGVRGSAPAFVFFSMFFIWGVYIAVLSQAISLFVDFVFCVQLLVLIICLCRILSGDPGIVVCKSSCVDKLVYSPRSEVDGAVEGSVTGERVRYCSHCNVYIKKFDHHCPAFGNCIGQRNHFLFVILLAVFIICEASYVTCAYQFARKFEILEKTVKEIGLSGNLAVSTMFFSILQVLWQVMFLIWHIYCICSNITTDEWINWRKYPEFKVSIQHQLGQPPMTTRFVNPYNKGIIWNLKEFLNGNG